MMRPLALLAAVALGGISVAPPPALHVLRTSPSGAAEPTSSISVVFDRPVAGQLDGTVDPRTIFTIAPAVGGLVEWRDPITLRFTPSGTLTPGTSYTVTIANSFQAMDGSRLEQPYRFTVNVGGPRPLDGSPAGPYASPLYLTAGTDFDILVSAPADLAVLSRLARLDFDSKCAGPSQIALTVTAQRPVSERDPDRFRYAGGWNQSPRAAALKRVVRLHPQQPLPMGCIGHLMLPPTVDAAVSAPFISWSFATHGPLRLAGVSCSNGPQCPAGWAHISFSTPVRGADVLRAVHISPATAFTVEDTTGESTEWNLEAALRTRTSYTVSVDASLRDIFDQPIGGTLSRAFATTGYAAALDFPTGRMMVERNSFRTIAVKHVNVETLLVATAAVPESLEARVLATPQWNLGEVWDLVEPLVTTRAVPVNPSPDTPLVSAVRLPVYNAARPGGPTLTVVRISSNHRDSAETGRRYRRGAGTALVQVTDIGLAARLGAEEAVAWVTTVHDGQALAGAAVTLYGTRGQVRARGTSDAQGLVRLTGFAADKAGDDGEDEGGSGFQGYIGASFENDRAVVAFDSYSWELSPWRFNVGSAFGAARLPAAAALFTERGIYRPGETVHAKAIVRTGTLGNLRVPPPGDSLRWLFSDREDGTVRDTIVTGSAFGTAEQHFVIPADLPLGTYGIAVKVKRGGSWTELARTWYRVAEYRPPEFLVSVAADTAGRQAGDTLTATVEARYLFGAPMAGAALSWTARRVPLYGWELDIPGTEGWQVGETGYWWEDEQEAEARVETLANGADTLDAGGHLVVRLPVAAPKKGRPARLLLQATVTDVNRQTVSGTATVMVHPASIYLAARPRGNAWFWTAGTPVEIGVMAVRPSGEHVAGVAVHGAIVRREWHRVQRRREGLDERVGDWVSDTVAQCDLTTTADALPCRFTPAAGGSYVVSFTARDERGRTASTSFYRWATGRGWVPWGDENQFKMDVIPDRTRYNVGDTATVLFAAPFTDAEAWITVEREGIIEQRRLRITAGATSLKLPLTEAYVPNAFVSIVLARGRSAPAGGIADAGRPTIRVGYAELKVLPRIKRLTVDVHPVASEYRPGDSARVRLRVRDSGGTGRRSEVTLWAVDEGVLSLTGYQTPDPVELLYRPRGVGMRLTSSLVSVAAQVLEDEGTSLKGDRAPGGGGGREVGDILRSRFQTTAFFLGSVLTDENGDAEAAAKLPDNLTTFRVMAVAVTAGDRYGSGQSPLLVTRPLLARPALPRFLRRDDRIIAGVVVNARGGGTPTVRVRAASRGAAVTEPSVRSATLASGRGTEVRFVFRDTTADSTTFRFDVSNGRDSDAVLTRLPVRPSTVPRAHTASGMVRLTSTTELVLPGDIDPARSTLVFGIGTTPLVVVRGMYRNLAAYPYDCSEQITDALLPIIALLKAGTAADGQRFAPANAAQQIAAGVAVLSRRQRTDGGIGLWNAQDWTTPWLSAHAGEALLAARAAGVPVRDSVLGRLADYLTRSLHQSGSIEGPLRAWYDLVPVRLAENVAALDYLSRLGRPDVAAENDALRLAPQMAWEDRVRLAEILSRRRAMEAARRLLAPVWAGVRVEGRRAVFVDTVTRAFYFHSARRPLARLLSATLAVDSTHALIGPLVESLVEAGRDRYAWWNTQDYGAAVEALANFTARQLRAARRGFTVAARGQVLFRAGTGGDVMRELSRDLTGLLTPADGGVMKLALTIAAPSGDDAPPLYYYVTVNEVPRVRPVTPDQQGIEVERWYEDYNTGRPVISVAEGTLVRVRLRIRIPAERRFLALSDPLPAGLEAVDLSLRTAGVGPAAGWPEGTEETEGTEGGYRWGWYFGSWDSGWWSPFDHREMRDDRVDYVATYLWPGSYTASYIARATTPGVFVRPPAYAQEMYNPAVQGRSDGGIFTVTRGPAR